MPGIVQQLQDRDHGSTAFELAIEVGRASVRVAEAQAALSEAKEGETQARTLLQELQAADGGNCTTAFELGCGIGRAMLRVAEAKTALSEAERGEGRAQAQLQVQLDSDGKPDGVVSDAYVGEIFAAYMAADDVLYSIKEWYVG
jgi:hypothetical protein